MMSPHCSVCLTFLVFSKSKRRHNIKLESGLLYLLRVKQWVFLETLGVKEIESLNQHMHPRKSPERSLEKTYQSLSELGEVKRAISQTGRYRVMSEKSGSGVGVIEGVTFRQASNGRVDDCQSTDGPSLMPSRSSPFIFQATKVLTDRQVSDGPSW
ncbi:hypothetical protein HAX54_041977 [Datura stramonium]|uniref:Uncharacterized protein n=1 Tax=Datura stramonium TaxID=4076 RepID=A0ABS8SLP5_DATST|nr:hypothetical protein [Datura stramonium]